MYQEIPALSFIFAALSLVPLAWYLRARNIAAVAIGTWLSVTNSIYAIDALIWAKNTNIKVAVWCDLATALITGSHVAIPAACLSICLHLERLAAFTTETSTPQGRRRRIIFEGLMCFGVPLVYISLHLIVQSRRFDLFPGFGCRPATYPTVATIFLVVIPPVLLTILTVFYAGMACHHLLVHRIQFYQKRGSISALTRNLYLRLVGMAILEAVFSTVLVAVMMWRVYSPGTAFVGNVSRHLNEVLIWDPGMITGNVGMTLEIEWLVTVVQSLVFFGLFACRMEVVRQGFELITLLFRRGAALSVSDASVEQANLESFPSMSTSVPTLPTTVVDLALVSSTLTQHECPEDKLSVPTCPPTPTEVTEDEVVIAGIDHMIPLASPARSSAMASSHNSLESNFDTSWKLDFLSPDVWPRTPTAIPVRFPRPLPRTYSVEYVSKHWLCEYAVH